MAEQIPEQILTAEQILGNDGENHKKESITGFLIERFSRSIRKFKDDKK